MVGIRLATELRTGPIDLEGFLGGGIKEIGSLKINWVHIKI